MRKATQIIEKKIEAIETSVNQYKEGLITGPETLLLIITMVNDPVIQDIHEYECKLEALNNDLWEKIQARKETPEQ